VRPVYIYRYIYVYIYINLCEGEGAGGSGDGGDELLDPALRPLAEVLFLPDPSPAGQHAGRRRRTERLPWRGRWSEIAEQRSDLSAGEAGDDTDTKRSETASRSECCRCGRDCADVPLARASIAAPSTLVGTQQSQGTSPGAAFVPETLPVLRVLPLELLNLLLRKRGVVVDGLCPDQRPICRRHLRVSRQSVLTRTLEIIIIYIYNFFEIHDTFLQIH
jgi:hypothetical protein